MSLPPGIYERLVTAGLTPRISTPELKTLLGQIDDEELPVVLARHIAAALAPHLRSLTREEQLAFVNALPLRPEELVEGTGRVLLAVDAASDPRDLLTKVRPQIPLGEPALLTNATGDPSLQS